MENSIRTTEYLRQLFEKDHWSDEEKHRVLQYLEQTDNAEIRSLMEEKFSNDLALNTPHEDAERLLSLIHAKIGVAKPKAGRILLNNWKRLSIAASVILIAGAATFLYFNNSSANNTNIASIQKPAKQKNDAAPGHDNAMLTLADGSTIILDSAANGELAQEGNMKVLKIDGQITYAGNSEADRVIYNTMTTARGNQYQLQLADGSKVWLNAASSIRFPTAFTGNERKVEITGEAYFEVAKNPSRPFKVLVASPAGGMEVEVLGTHFNINAYDDEAAVKTTLAEGKVKVTTGRSLVMLQPSQQAVLNKENQQLKAMQANLEKELAWRMGMFEFQDDDLLAVMRQLSRWYDVDVSFSGAVSKKLYTGSIRRQATLSQAFQILKLAGVSYTLEGKAITVKSD